MRHSIIILLLLMVIGCDESSYVDANAPPIVNAAQRGDLAAVKRVVARNPSALYDADSYGNTAAHCAILNDHHEIAIYLIESGYPVNPSGRSDFPLIMACLSRYTEGSRAMLRYLLENGADPNVAYAPEGWVALNMAANNGQEENVRLLVQYGAKLDSKDRQGLTALEMAKNRLAQFKDPQFDYPHGELSDPETRKRLIDKWERMVKLLAELDHGT